MDDCILITTAHDESIALKAVIESKCNESIILYQHSYEELNEASFGKINYIQINGYHSEALKEIDKVLKNIKKAKFYLANIHLDEYVLFYLLSKKKEYEIWIFDNNEFKKMPQEI